MHDDIYIPRALIMNNKNVNLSIDTMYVNGLCFFTSISYDIHYRTAQFIPNRKADTHQKALKEVIHLYHKGDFRIKNMYCNNELGQMFKDIISIYKINVHSVPAQLHVSKAERNIQVIKERVRSSVHYLPYEKIPKIILLYIVQEAANKLNYFPVKNGISPHYSPRMIVSKKTLNYATHRMHDTGEFVMAHNDKLIKNNLNPRALECICIFEILGHNIS